jgi:hypothetical protein
MTQVKIDIPPEHGAITSVDPMLQLQLQLNRIEEKLDELLEARRKDEESLIRLREQWSQASGMTE